MSGRGITAQSARSNQKYAPGDSQLSSIKFTRPIEIISGLVADALDNECALEELIKLQRTNWFAYPRAQQWLMDEVWSQERKEFDQLLQTCECSDRLRGCMNHRGELFDKYAQPRHSEGLGSDVVLNQRIAWADLMTEELEYLGRQAQWHDHHRMMATHACGVMSKLLEAWTLPANGEVPPHVLPRLLDAMRAIAQGAPLKRLLSQEFSHEETVVLSGFVMLAAALDDIELTEEVADLLPTIFELCQTHLPEDFCKVQLDDVDFDDEFDDDDIDDSDMSDQRTDFLSEEFAEDMNESLISEGYEILDEEEVLSDPAALYSQYLEAERESLKEVLVPSLGLCLREVRRAPVREARIEYLQNIILSSPIGMVLWQEVVDTLIFISPSGFNDVLPLLLQRCVNDIGGGDCILGIADYSFRKDLEWNGGPLPALAKELKAMKDSDRRGLLQSASEFLDEGPDLFLDFDATEAGFTMLCEMVEMRGLMRGR